MPYDGFRPGIPLFPYPDRLDEEISELFSPSGGDNPPGFPTGGRGRCPLIRIETSERPVE